MIVTKIRVQITLSLMLVVYMFLFYLLHFIGATASGGSSPKNKRVPPLKINGKDHLPFQLQIEYTGKDGSRCVRVLTQAKPVTKDRDLAEKG